MFCWEGWLNGHAQPGVYSLDEVWALGVHSGSQDLFRFVVGLDKVEDGADNFLKVVKRFSGRWCHGCCRSCGL